MHFGFSYIGLIFLLMLFIPNLFWSKHKPENYDKYVKNENKTLRIFEGAGQVLVTCIVLIFKDFNIKTGSWWIIWLMLSFVFMVLYEIYWIKYFKSKKNNAGFLQQSAWNSCCMCVTACNCVFIVGCLRKKHTACNCSCDSRHRSYRNTHKS